MTRRDLLILFVVGLIVPLVIAQFQSLPGYMDADYYFGGGIQLVKGNGFSEPYLWNYLDDPRGLPHPSHTYWMPLASLLAAMGMWITGQATFPAARLGFILIAALVPPLTGLLAIHFTSNRTLSMLSGMLACFPIYYAPFLPVTDNYAIYMVLGASYFIILSSLFSSKKNSVLFFLGFGLVSAMMALARSDGLLWLGISLLIALWYAMKSRKTDRTYPSFFRFLLYSSCVLAGYILLSAPWYARNLSIFGTLMAPGGSRALWLTNYNDTFTYPATKLTLQAWFASGWEAILSARLHALRLNLLNAFAAQGGIFLFPFILTGLWHLRKDARVRVAALAWILLLAAMTIVFPFAGPRGAFFHAGAALQPVWWAVAPPGLDVIIGYARRRGWFDDRAIVIFRVALAGIAVLMTAAIFTIRVLPGWEREDGQYSSVAKFLIHQGVPPDAITIIRNPPGFNVVTNRPAIALPTGGVPAILAVAKRYHAKYLVLEPEGTSNLLRALFDQPNSDPNFRFLGEIDGIRLYEIIR